MIKQILDFKSIPIKSHWLGISIGAVSIFLTLQQYTLHLIAEYDFDFSGVIVFLKNLINYSTWILFLPIIHRITMKFLNRGAARLRIITILVFQSMMIALTHRIISSRGNDVLNYFRTGYLREFLGTNSLTELGIGFFSSLIELSVIVSILLVINYQKKSINQEKDLAKAELNALRMQLNPHFLFNTLHSISSLIDIDSNKAHKMISRLGILFRKVLETEDKNYVTIEEELKYVQEYLEIERIRFDQLNVKYDLDQRLSSKVVPGFILQPLIENAVKYGPGKIGSGNEIHVKTGFVDNPKQGFYIQVENDLNNNTKAGTGMGLNIVRKRLEHLYDHFNFETFQVNGRFCARIEIPLQ